MGKLKPINPTKAQIVANPQAAAHDYDNLTHKPQINGHGLIGDKSSDDLGLQGKLTAGENITINANGEISATGGTITSTAVNQNGTITFIMSDGSTVTTTGESVIGPKGDNGDTGAAGADGYSPTVSTTNLDAQTLVTVTDNNGAHNFYVKDGSSVTNAAVDENGDLIISIQQKPTSSVHPTIHTLEVNAGHVVGAAGAKGDKGDKGDTGNDYVLTSQDKTDIANIVLQLLPTTQGVLYGNSSD